MSQGTAPAGLPLRLKAAARLEGVLKGGPFLPFAAYDFLEGRERALANRLVTTALRRHGHLNVAIKQLLERGLPRKSGSFEAVLRLSLAQMLFLPELGDHSAVYLGVEALKRDGKARHLAGLLNAVLRRAQSEAEALRALPLEQLLPEAVRRRWSSAYGEAAVHGFAEALQRGAALDLTLKHESPALVELLGGRALVGDTVRIDDRDRPVEQLPGYAEGRWWVQDAAAAVPARLLAVAPGSRVLDLCAAPGGKTAQLLRAGYQVTALDHDPERVLRLAGNLRRLGYHTELVTADGTSFRPGRPFDAVLLDAPCTATGTFRRHPEVIWNRSAADLASRVALQRRFIANAVQCVRPGGVLIYCVCSLEPEEGEEQLAWIAANCPELELDQVLPAELPGLEGAVHDGGWVRTHPAQRVATGEAGDKDNALDGFFIARFRRR